MTGILWRPVMARMASYQEVCERWTLDEVLEAHELLDAQEREQKRQMAQQQAARVHSKA